MMDMSTMSIGMMVGMGLVWLVILAFLVLGIAAFIKISALLMDRRQCLGRLR
jgi:hypothetical protein